MNARPALVVACILVLALRACAKSPEPTDVGFPKACVAILASFCLSKEMSAYSITIERKVQDLHSDIYFVKANARDSGRAVAARDGRAGA